MACCLLLSAITASWAQKSLPVTSPVSLSDSEYVINGPVEAEVGIGRVYTYTRYLPKGAGSVYWYVEGARLINGKRARLLKEGYLNARQYPELRIEWDSIKTAQGQGLLQLRQRRLQRVAVNKVPQQAGTLTSADLTGDETVEVLASSNIVVRCPPCLPDFGLCDSGIYYLGRIGSPSTSTEIREYTYVCSDANVLPADPRHRYSARLACNGPIYFNGGNGTAGPLTIIWNVE